MPAQLRLVFRQCCTEPAAIPNQSVINYRYFLCRNNGDIPDFHLKQRGQRIVDLRLIVYTATAWILPASLAGTVSLCRLSTRCLSLFAARLYFLIVLIYQNDGGPVSVHFLFLTHSIGHNDYFIPHAGKPGGRSTDTDGVIQI